MSQQIGAVSARSKPLVENDIRAAAVSPEGETRSRTAFANRRSLCGEELLDLVVVSWPKRENALDRRRRIFFCERRVNADPELVCNCTVSFLFDLAIETR